MALIVGIDGSEESERALSWAIEEAKLRGEDLVAVHAYSTPLAYTPYTEFPGGPDPQVADEVRRGAEDLLDRVIEGVRDQLGDLQVVTEVVEDPQPARSLTERAGGQDILVVGSRGRGGFTGLLLGSVSQQCTQHAGCPVVVVPAGA